MSIHNRAIGASAIPGAPGPQDRMALICKALGHPVRLQIVQLLKAQKKCFCGQIVSRLPLAQSTVSQHLKCLKGAGIVVGLKKGTATCYGLDKALLKQFHCELTQFLDDL